MSYCMVRNEYINENDDQCELGSKLVMENG